MSEVYLKSLKKFVQSSWVTDTIPFVAVWGVDRLTKMWAVGLDESALSYGQLVFETHYNHGVMLGTFSDLPPIMRLVALTSVGAFILCSYVFLRILVPMGSPFLKSGIAIQVSGILGNVADRMLGNGGVVDFISFRFETFRTPIWNVADMFQLLGYVFVIYGLWQDSKHYWPKEDLRRTFWINPKFQWRFCLLIMGTGGAVGLVTSVMSYTFMRTTLQAMGATADDNNSYLFSFVMAVGIMQACLSMMLFLLGSYVSNRVAGPIYAAKRFITDTLNGSKAKNFKLRKYDEFKELENVLSDLNKKFAQMQADLLKEEEVDVTDDENDKAA